MRIYRPKFKHFITLLKALEVSHKKERARLVQLQQQGRNLQQSLRVQMGSTPARGQQDRVVEEEDELVVLHCVFLDGGHGDLHQVRR